MNSAVGASAATWGRCLGRVAGWFGGEDEEEQAGGGERPFIRGKMNFGLSFARYSVRSRAAAFRGLL